MDRSSSPTCGRPCERVERPATTQQRMSIFRSWSSCGCACGCSRRTGGGADHTPKARRRAHETSQPGAHDQLPALVDARRIIEGSANDGRSRKRAACLSGARAAPVMLLFLIDEAIHFTDKGIDLNRLHRTQLVLTTGPTIDKTVAVTAATGGGMQSGHWPSGWNVRRRRA